MSSWAAAQADCRSTKNKSRRRRSGRAARLVDRLEADGAAGAAGSALCRTVVQQGERRVKELKSCELARTREIEPAVCGEFANGGRLSRRTAR